MSSLRRVLHPLYVGAHVPPLGVLHHWTAVVVLADGSDPGVFGRVHLPADGQLCASTSGLVPVVVVAGQARRVHLGLTCVGSSDVDSEVAPGSRSPCPIEMSVILPRCSLAFT